MRRIYTLVVVLVLVMGLLVGFSRQANATLITIGTADYDTDNDGIADITNLNLIYDDDSPFGPIVWLDYTTNDWANWQTQVAWAAGLNDPGVLTYYLNPGTTVLWTGDWRLPHAEPVCGDSYNCTGSEFGHLYYTELGNTAYGPLSNTGPFTNVISHRYWLGTEDASNTQRAWQFNFETGFQSVDGKEWSKYAIAVRPADVSTAAPVPEPSTLFLLGSGLAGLAGFRRVKRRG